SASTWKARPAKAAVRCANATPNCWVHCLRRIDGCTRDLGVPGALPGRRETRLGRTHPKVDLGIVLGWRDQWLSVSAPSKGNSRNVLEYGHGGDVFPESWCMH